MTKETLLTTVIPAILIFCLVFFNIRKMQKRAKIMRMEQEGRGSGSCAGCAHGATCRSPQKKEEEQKNAEN